MNQDFYHRDRLNQQQQDRQSESLNKHVTMETVQLEQNWADERVPSVTAAGQELHERWLARLRNRFFRRK